MRVYLDLCCFNRPFDEPSQSRIREESEAQQIIQNQILREKLQLTWSYMLEFENAQNRSNNRRIIIQRWSQKAAVWISQSEEITNTAKSINEFGIKPKDSLHLACALAAKCNVFLTTDDGILKKRNSIRDIAVMNPVEFVREYLQS